MKKLAAILLFFTLIQACGEKVKLEITGNVPAESASTVKKMYLFQLVESKLSRIDSAVVEANGEYEFKIKDEKKGVYFFGPSEMNVMTLVLDENSNKVKIEISDLKLITNNCSVSGSSESEKIVNFTNLTNAVYKEMQELQGKMSRSSSPEVLAQVQTEGVVLQDKITKIRDLYIEDNKNSPALIAALSTINPSTEFELLKTTVSNLEKSIPNSPLITSIKKDLAKMEEQIAQQEQQKQQQNLALPIGSIAPELDFPNPKGKNIKLTSLRGKVVLLDFWASWCRPCRAANPHVVSLYNKYKKKGFTVYSFSLDNNKDKWIKAIEKDGLTWKNHTSDLKQWQTAAIGIYKFNSIPYTVLIGRDGKILGKNLKGKALESKLLEVL